MKLEDLKSILEFTNKKAVDSYKPGTTTTGSDGDSDTINNVGRTAATSAAGALANKVVGAVAGRAGVAGLLYPDTVANGEKPAGHKPDFSHGEKGTEPKPKSVTAPPEKPKAAETTPSSSSSTTPKSSVTGTSTSSSSSTTSKPAEAPKPSTSTSTVSARQAREPEGSAPKSTVSAPVKSTNDQSFASAFKAAREKAGNSTGTFTWKGKTYQTNRAGEKYVNKSKQTPVKEETLEEAKSPWREHRDASEYHKNQARRATKSGDHSLAKAHTEAHEAHEKAYYEHSAKDTPYWVESGKAKGTPGALQAATEKAKAASAAIKKPVKEETMEENKLIAAVLNLTSESKSDNLFAEQAKQINELSKKTLGSYVKKAAKDVEKTTDSAARVDDRVSRRDTDDRDGDLKKIDKLDDKINKRQKGIGKATDRLTKEDVALSAEETERLDEIARNLIEGSDPEEVTGEKHFTPPNRAPDHKISLAKHGHGPEAEAHLYHGMGPEKKHTLVVIHKSTVPGMDHYAYDHKPSDAKVKKHWDNR